MHTQCLHFSELTPFELYECLRLRSEVFVLEQKCLFQDLDNLDQNAHHLLMRQSNQVVAYARLLENPVSIGRVITAPAFRGCGIGEKLMQEALSACAERWPNQTIHLGAQAHLRGFYEKMGFRQAGEGYVEDGIPHIPMQR